MDVCNYRPVSILSILSKILERHVHITLYGFLEAHKLITPDQSGFRPYHSCETALLKMTDEWLDNIDNGKITGLIYVDLRKAFDTVNHEYLLQKLVAYGVSEESWYWFCTYLTKRTQQVHWQGETSQRQDITVGVPQGSILGPLLFTLYINDLPDCLDEKVHMYADDSTLMSTDKTLAALETKMSASFHQMAKWMASNKLTLHVGKTKVQLIGSYKKVTMDTKFTIEYNGQPLEQIHTAKLLGVYIDSNLTWQNHYDYICKKMSQKIGVLK